MDLLSPAYQHRNGDTVHNKRRHTQKEIGERQRERKREKNRTPLKVFSLSRSSFIAPHTWDDYKTYIICKYNLMDFFLFISKHFLLLSATTPYPLFLFILYLNCCFLWYYLLNAPSFFSGWVWCSGRELEADWKNINGHIYVHSYHYYSFFLTFLIGRFSSFYSSLWWSDDEVFFHWTKRNAAASSCVIVLFLASLYVNYNSYYVQF